MKFRVNDKVVWFGQEVVVAKIDQVYIYVRMPNGKVEQALEKELSFSLFKVA